MKLSVYVLDRHVGMLESVGDFRSVSCIPARYGTRRPRVLDDARPH
jgi:hypothetical protein